jgi:hypothetical protein
LTGSESKHWTKDLIKLIKLMNVHVKERDKKKKEIDPLGDVLCEGDTCNMLAEGDKVRVALEYPIDPVTHKKLHGKFRSSDIRWHPDIRTINHVLLKPNFPPMYLLDGNVGPDKVHPVAYTKNQLQLVPKNEKLPNTNTIRGAPKKYIIEEIVSKKKISNKIYYEVKWVGFESNKNTFEPKSTLIKEVPHLIAAFESGK